MLERYVFLGLGAVPLSDVTKADVRQVILVAREKVPGAMKKLVDSMSFVFNSGFAEGHSTDNPAASQVFALPRDTCSDSTFILECRGLGWPGRPFLRPWSEHERR